MSSEKQTKSSSKTKSVVSVNGHAVRMPNRFISVYRALRTRHKILYGLLAICLISGGGFLLARHFNVSSGSSNAATPYDTSSSADTVILSYTKPHVDKLIGTNIDPTQTAPLVLYGNGLAVCGTDNSAAAGTQYQETSIMLSRPQIHNLVLKIVKTGFLNLNPEYFSKFPIAEKQDIIRLNLLSGNHFVMYYNDMPPPPAYASTAQIINNFCRAITIPYQPVNVTIHVKKNANPNGQSVIADNTLSSNLGTAPSSAVQSALDKVSNASVPNTTVVDQTVSGSTAQQLVKQLKGKTHTFVQLRGVNYEVAITKNLPTPTNILQNIDYKKLRSKFNKNISKTIFYNSGINSTSSNQSNILLANAIAGGTPVRTVVFLAADGGDPNWLGTAQSQGQQIHDWYCAQVGQCYNYIGAQIIRGSQTEAYYRTCHDPNGCSDPLYAIIENIASVDAGTVYRSDIGTQVILGFPTFTSVCGIGFIGANLGITDPYTASYNTQGISFCQHVKDLAHEFGHNIGFQHTGNGTLMDGPPYTQYASACGVGNDPGYPTCKLDFFQALYAATTAFFTPPGGFLGSAPAVASWAPNRLDVFARGVDNQLWHDWYAGTSWSGWGPLGGSLASSPAVAAWAPNRLDVFYRAPSCQVYHVWYASGRWNGPDSLGGCITGAPAVASWAPNRLDVFARGVDNQLWHDWYAGTSWSGWGPLGGSLASSPAVAAWAPNRLDIVAQGTDNQIWHLWWNGASWVGWQALGGILTSAPAISSWGPNRLDIFARGIDGAMWHDWYAGTSWSGWEPLGGILTSAPAAVSWAPNRVDLFARGTNGALWHDWYAGTSWSGWGSLGGQLSPFNY